MKKEEIVQILSDHLNWINGKEEGKNANLQFANLQFADLHDANLHGANLQYADLQYANLQYADLDFSCWPLWCGSIGVKVDLRIAQQLAYHAFVVKCDDPEFIRLRNIVSEFANQFDRVKSKEIPEI